MVDFSKITVLLTVWYCKLKSLALFVFNQMIKRDIQQRQEEISLSPQKLDSSESLKESWGGLDHLMHLIGLLNRSFVMLMVINLVQWSSTGSLLVIYMLLSLPQNINEFINCVHLMFLTSRRVPVHLLISKSILSALWTHHQTTPILGYSLELTAAYWPESPKLVY